MQAAVLHSAKPVLSFLFLRTGCSSACLCRFTRRNTPISHPLRRATCKSLFHRTRQPDVLQLRHLSRPTSQGLEDVDHLKERQERRRGEWRKITGQKCSIGMVGTNRRIQSIKKTICNLQVSTTAWGVKRSAVLFGQTATLEMELLGHRLENNTCSIYVQQGLTLDIEGKLGQPLTSEAPKSTPSFPRPFKARTESTEGPKISRKGCDNHMA